MSNGEVRKVTPEDIQQVQHLIEWCLQLYMNKKEVVKTLQQRANIEPGFTELVWKKLEEQNQKFFKAYHFRLILKGQISKFNELLEIQAELMKQISATNVAASVPITNNNSQAMKVGNMHQPALANSSSGLTNGVGMSGLSRLDDVSPNLQIMPEEPVSSFIGEESILKPMNEPGLEPNSFGLSGQIPRNFSLSDLTADFSLSSDILDSYSGSPYLAANTEFFNFHGNGDIQGGHWAV